MSKFTTDEVGMPFLLLRDNTVPWNFYGVPWNFYGVPWNFYGKPWSLRPTFWLKTFVNDNLICTQA